MMARETFESCPEFLENWERIKKELSLPPDYTARQVWGVLPDLETFGSKCTFPKLGRWFSWNQAAEEQLKEWTALKCVLAYHFGHDAALDPDEAQRKRTLGRMVQEDARNAGHAGQDSLRKQFGRLKEQLGGGLKLSYHLMSKKLYQMCTIICVATRPTWSWYTHTVKDVKSPDDNLVQLVKLSDSWNSEPHLKKTAAIAISRDSQLVDLLQSMDFEDTACKTASLSHHILKRRAWSLAKNSAPPDCYAGLLSTDYDVAKASVVSGHCV